MKPTGTIVMLEPIDEDIERLENIPRSTDRSHLTLLPGGRINEPPTRLAPEDRPRLGMRYPSDLQRESPPGLFDKIARCTYGWSWDNELGWIRHAPASTRFMGKTFPAQSGKFPATADLPHALMDLPRDRQHGDQ